MKSKKQGNKEETFVSEAKNKLKSKRDPVVSITDKELK